MDPDMVRQQAEAELEHRLGAQLMAKSPPPKKSPAIKTDPADVPEQTVIRTVIHTPVTGRAKSTKPTKPPRWRFYAQMLFGSSALVCMAALIAAAWGANQGLSMDGQLWLGSGAAILMAVVYGGLFSLSGRKFTPAGRHR